MNRTKSNNSNSFIRVVTSQKNIYQNYYKVEENSRNSMRKGLNEHI